MVMILSFSSDWIATFYAETNSEDENLDLVDVNYSSRNPKEVLLQLASSIFRSEADFEQRTLL